MFKNWTTYKGITFVLFLFLFVYLLLRAYFVDPLHDEIATYFFFIYHGDFIGEHIVWDANNHLLNSALGHLIYKMFGDNMFLLRMPNVLAFPLYAFGLYQIIQFLKTEWLKIVTFCGVVCIPFVLEYFANCRGYGLSLGLFFFGLSSILKFLNEGKSKQLWLGYLTLLLAVSANLTLLNITLLLIVLTVGINILKRQKIKPTIGTSVLFVIALLPLIWFGFKLKEHGALYYGSLDGIWDVTGASLSKYVFFLEGWIPQVIVITGSIFILITLGMTLKRTGFKSFIQTPNFSLGILFFGSNFGAIVLATFMEINYPEDRAAMYLVPLFILLLSFGFETFKKVSYLGFIILYFPVTLVMNLNLHTSVFTPDDRMTKTFYDEVKKVIGPEDNLMIYQTMSWNWPYHESHNPTKSSVANWYQPETAVTDVLLTKTTVMKDPKVYKGYDTIFIDEASTYIALKRKTPLDKALLYTSSIVNIAGEGEYLSVFESDSLAYIPRNKPIQVTVEGHLKTVDKMHYASLIVHTFDKDNNQIDWKMYPFDVYFQNQLIDDDFKHHFIFDSFDENIALMKVYIWNKGLHHLQLDGGKCYIYEVKIPDNGIR